MKGSTLPALIKSFVIYMDIVDSTRQSDEIQVNMMEHLYRLVIRTLRERQIPHFHKENDIQADFYSNTTGDGIVFVIADSYDKMATDVFDCVVKIYELFESEFKDFIDKNNLSWKQVSIEESVNGMALERGFGERMARHDINGWPKDPKIRAAIHYGPTKWSHSRVNGRLIVQGEGLNTCARALVLARRDHLIVTDSFFKLWYVSYKNKKNYGTRKFSATVKSKEVIVHNIFSASMGNFFSPYNPTYMPTIISNSLLSLLKIFSVKLKYILNATERNIDIEGIQYTVTLLTREKDLEGNDITFPWANRLDQDGKIKKIKSLMSYPSGIGCPGKAWELGEMQYINDLPFVDDKHGDNFVSYCEKLYEKMDLTLDEVKRFAFKYNNHLPRCFVSFPLLASTGSYGEIYKCGILSCDFSDPLPLNERKWKLLHKKVREEIGYFAALLGEVTPDKELL